MNILHNKAAIIALNTSLDLWHKMVIPNYATNARHRIMRITHPDLYYQGAGIFFLRDGSELWENLSQMLALCDFEDVLWASVVEYSGLSPAITKRILSEKRIIFNGDEANVLIPTKLDCTYKSGCKELTKYWSEFFDLNGLVSETAIFYEGYRLTVATERTKNRVIEELTKVFGEELADILEADYTARGSISYLRNELHVDNGLGSFVLKVRSVSYHGFDVGFIWGVFPPRNNVGLEFNITHQALSYLRSVIERQLASLQNKWDKFFANEVIPYELLG